MTNYIDSIEFALKQLGVEAQKLDEKGDIDSVRRMSLYLNTMLERIVLDKKLKPEWLGRKRGG